jgi:hypothetical protein
VFQLCDAVTLDAAIVPVVILLRLASGQVACIDRQLDIRRHSRIAMHIVRVTFASPLYDPPDVFRWLRRYTCRDITERL